MLPHAARLRGFAARHFPLIASDVAQKVLLRAWMAREELDPARDLWPWLQSVALNVGRRRLAREARSVSVAELDSEGDSCVPPQPELVNDLHRCLERLSDEERSLVRRFYFEGDSVAELAIMGACSEGTVKARLSRVRSKIAWLLGSIGGATLLLIPLLRGPRAAAPPAQRREPRLLDHSFRVEVQELRPSSPEIRRVRPAAPRGWTVEGGVLVGSLDARLPLAQ